MMQRVAKILSSDSQMLYHARVLSASECAEPPKPADYALGQFVQVKYALEEADDEQQTADTEVAVGLIVNSRLLNPEGPYSGPRLTLPHEQNAVFAPDYLEDTGVLVSILIVGHVGRRGCHQGIPLQVLPVGSEVLAMASGMLRRFHFDAQERFQLRYFHLLQECGRAFAPALFSQVQEQLNPLLGVHDQRLLSVLRKNLAWEASAMWVRS
ncbi:MAG: hypothetical protein AAGJ35_01125 [Myxococcota bacterium]